MVLGVLSGGGWWQHAEQVVAPWAGAVEEQEPRCLEVVLDRKPHGWNLDSAWFFWAVLWNGPWQQNFRAWHTCIEQQLE